MQAAITVNIRLYGTLVHFVAHLVFQELYSLTTATSCRLLDRANELRSFRTIVRCCSLVRPQRSRSSQLYGRVPSTLGFSAIHWLAASVSPISHLWEIVA